MVEAVAVVVVIVVGARITMAVAAAAAGAVVAMATTAAAAPSAFSSFLSNGCFSLHRRRFLKVWRELYSEGALLKTMVLTYGPFEEITGKL